MVSEPMLKILIAEDDRVSARILETHLKKWGYEVFLEKDGEDAWQTLDRENIQIAILDWMMPKLNGIQLCRKIRKRESDFYTYIILLTARTSTEDIVKGLNSGADDYITKPVEYLELQARLKTGRRIIELENHNRKLRDRLEKIAQQDSLTGFLNKRNITEQLEKELSRGRRDHSAVSCILLDIDKFKQINDTYGHHVGDQVLVEMASRFRKNVRKHDQIGRYGGDEIMVLAWDADEQTLIKVSERLRRSVVGKPFATDAGPLEISISLGGASTISSPDLSAEELIKLSDQALYRAKSKGRNRTETIKAIP
jgi:diguanylate cyclase (GGDEF)-like protein